MFCLWHIRKAWKDNTVQKIKDPILRVQILKVVADIMYSSDLIQGEAAVTRAKLKITGMRDDLQRFYPLFRGNMEWKNCNVGNRQSKFFSLWT